MADFAAPYNALISQNLAGANSNPLAMAGQFAQTKSALANADTATATADDAQLANAQNHLGMILGAVAPVAAMGDKATVDDVSKAGADLVFRTKGTISPEEIAHFIGTLPTAPPPLADGTPAPNPGLAKFLQQHQLTLLGAQQRIATMRGDPYTLNYGGGTQTGTINSFTGAREPNGNVTNTMSPEAAASAAPASVDPVTGVQRTQTLGERAEQAGLAAPATYSGRGGGGPQQVFVGADGRITKPRQGLGTPMAPSASGPIQTQLSPAQAAVVKASGDAYAGAQQNMATYAQREQQLESGLTALQSTSTGPGTESRNAIESYMLGLPGGLGRWIPGVDPKSVAAFDTANKYLTAAAAANPSAGRSDAGLSTAIASNPSVHISNQAAQDIQRANLGFIRFEKANMSSFDGQDASGWQSHIAQRNASIDPHAYSADLISPAQRAAYMASLSSSGKAKYFASIRDAMANGAFTPADLQRGSAGGQ